MSLQKEVIKASSRRKKSSSKKLRRKKTSKFGCSPRKSCRTVSSCTEAKYHLKICGNKRLDRDKDGIPCESICRGG